jgi:hypothetical protein|tara:strand:+ start:319 stop:546 length:228 start_codon:yes stop_codon:yes gene_type:complete
MKDKSKKNLFIEYHTVREIFNRRLYFIPKKYRWCILREMEDLKLIKKVGKKNNLSFKFVGEDADKLLRQFDVPIF